MRIFSSLAVPQYAVGTFWSGATSSSEFDWLDRSSRKAYGEYGMKI